jgi:hypothetical protein
MMIFVGILCGLILINGIVATSYLSKASDIIALGVYNITKECHDKTIADAKAYRETAIVWGIGSLCFALFLLVVLVVLVITAVR